eukprot:gb/GEZN01002696.1/.p1 GENE.gb/GEZN01002696.1/~~gb/GEZN01002696.1/.p1  ORF type:complete len:610 (-),score=113.25 gb/GEZN01002696.1/:503-2332(-)
MADDFILALAASVPLLAIGSFFNHSTSELAIGFSTVLFSTLVASRFLYSSSSRSSASPSSSTPTATLVAAEKVAPAIKEQHDYEYDVVVIGGGSGGLACAKECARLGAKTAVCDFVTPSPPGTTWGIGGTCVNVGCIPKKLMHQASLLGEGWDHHAKYFGWLSEGGSKHNWQTLVQNVQQHIRNLNTAYLEQLISQEVTYLNALASFKDGHTLRLVDTEGKETTTTANKFIVAVGGRPVYPDIPGAFGHAITSDDIFSLKEEPGQKVVVIGASYVALECAGFLRGLGYDVTVVVRSILLRGFDQDMAERIGAHLEVMGVKLLRGYAPVEITAVAGRTRKAKQEALKQVTIRATGKAADGPTGSGGSTDEIVLPCNTVLLAIGRYALTERLNLSPLGVKMDKNLKIIVKEEQSNVPHIYAIGDCAAPYEVRGQAPELTPLAIQVGKLLARRLFGDSKVAKEAKMDWRYIPTTVFTPLEYGAIGLTEEQANEQYGKEDVVVYRKTFVPLELSLLPRYLKPDGADSKKKKKGPDPFHCKLVCGPKGKALGFHYTGPNAGEVTQGFTVAMRLGATKDDFDMTIGIHPTCAEQLTLLPAEGGEEEEVEEGACTT